MAQSAIILPDGWQVAARAPEPGSDQRAVWWLQQRRVTYERHSADYDKAVTVWQDAILPSGKPAGPYTRRSNAVDAWRILATRALVMRYGKVNLMDVMAEFDVDMDEAETMLKEAGAGIIPG